MTFNYQMNFKAQKGQHEKHQTLFAALLQTPYLKHSPFVPDIDPFASHSFSATAHP